MHPQGPIQILLVEDDPAQATLLQEILHEPSERSCEVVWVDRIALAAEAMTSRSFDAVLLDLSLPDSRGLDTVQEAIRLAPQTPIIVMTGLDDQRLAVEAVRVGAQDYLVKGQVESRMLLRSLRYAMERMRLLTELRQARDQLEQRVIARTTDLADTVTALQTEVLDRRQAEASLREYQQYLSQVLTGSPVMLWAVDAKGVVTVLEGKSLTGIGLGAHCVIGMSIFQRDSHMGQFRRPVEAALRGHDVQVETRVGETILESRFSPLRDESGQVCGAIGVSLDITQRRQLETQVLEIGSSTRQSIGQDLHDSLGQTLTGMAFMTKVLQRKLENASAKKGDADEILRLALVAINQTRSLARGLCPVEFKAEGLMTALQEMANNCQQILGAQCRFECAGNVLLHDNTTASHLYHIAQEALSNAVRHGRARCVEIRLSEQDQTVTLSVHDDGKGIGEPGSRPGGMGLRIMDYRARVVGGSLSIRPKEPTGTVVTCTLPRGAQT